jgi:hypothetical protein
MVICCEANEYNRDIFSKTTSEEIIYELGKQEKKVTKNERS